MRNFFYKIQRNHSYPFIRESLHKISYEISPVMEIIAISENNIDLNEDIWKDRFVIYDRLINITKKALDLLEEHKEVKNSQWIKGIERNFVSVENMVQEIESYRHRRTMPLTWKGHSHNT